MTVGAELLMSFALIWRNMDLHRNLRLKFNVGLLQAFRNSRVGLLFAPDVDWALGALIGCGCRDAVTEP
jgi:hypothetical protein